MPLHLNSIIKSNNNSQVVAELLQQANLCNEVFATKDKKYIHMRKELVDKKSDEIIGHIVFTLMLNEIQQQLEILDIDIMLSSANKCEIFLEKMKPLESDGNEYYDAIVSETDQHFQLETVNRHIITGELENTTKKVSICAFPFKLDMYDSMGELNKAYGFENEVKVGNTDFVVGGYSDRFLSSGELFVSNENEYCSFVIGEVDSYKDVNVNVGNLEFTVIYLNTGMGIIPVAVNKDIFEIQSISKGKILAMLADIKADFSSEIDFIKGNFTNNFSAAWR